MGPAARLGCNFDEWWWLSWSIGNGESPQNTKLNGLTYSPLGVRSFTLYDVTFWGSLMIYGPFWDITAASHQHSWVNYGLWVNVPVLPQRGVLRLSQLSKREHWHDKKHYLTMQDLLVIGLLLQLAKIPACSPCGRGAPPLYMGITLPQVSRALCGFCKWLIVLSHCH